MILLRTLTEKSTLGFGMFADLRVGNLMKVNPQYLVWAYFHIDWMNYSEGVMKVLNLKEHEIEKPGIDYGYFDANCRIWGCYPTSKRKHGQANVEVLSKAHLKFKQQFGTKNAGLE